MKVSIYHRRRFHSDVIKRVIWLYFRFNLSLREIEEMMAERGVDVSYELSADGLIVLGLSLQNG